MITLACDVGGTTIKAGAVCDGRVLARAAIPARSGEGLRQRLPAIRDAIDQVAARAGTPARECRGVFFAMPGILDVAAARIVSVNAKWADAPAIDLRRWADETWGLPLSIENDARAALAGEWRHGAGQGCDDVVMLTLGTGIGTAVLTGGQLLRGPHGIAGNLGGHLAVQVGGRRCTCGALGCAEAEASQSVLPALARAHPAFAASRLARTDPLDYCAVFDAAEQGDLCATELRDHALRVWSVLVTNLVHAYDPQRIVVGGGIAQAPRLLPALQDSVDRNAWTPGWRVECVAAELGSDAALVGAEWLLTEATGGGPHGA